MRGFSFREDLTSLKFIIDYDQERMTAIRRNHINIHQAHAGPLKEGQTTIVRGICKARQVANCTTVPILRAMPELAEVEYYRKRWDPGLGEQIELITLHETKRIFRSTSVRELKELLPGTRLLSSEARGKQMLFRFSKQIWLGIHLGMTGKLRIEPPNFAPEKHDHLVLKQKRRSLVFADARLFGRVLFHNGAEAPEWWLKLPAPLNSSSFTVQSMGAFLQRRRKLPIKAALLLQEGFPGVGNWMADEILWRARIAPTRPAGAIEGKELKILWRSVRFVCDGAIKHISSDFADPPEGWLFGERWKRKGDCPIHKSELRKSTVGGRTTVWCAKCQRL